MIRKTISIILGVIIAFGILLMMIPAFGIIFGLIVKTLGV